MFTRALAIWLFLLILAVLNGGIREILITPRFGEQGGHLLSTAILCAAYPCCLVRDIVDRTEERTGGLVVGLAWVALTVAFEFLAATMFSAVAGRN